MIYLIGKTDLFKHFIRKTAVSQMNFLLGSERKHVFGSFCQDFMAFN